jgi:glyoxylase-like metal-dependent hydrolase (beta-lactamase superfamily II)
VAKQAFSAWLVKDAERRVNFLVDVGSFSGASYLIKRLKRANIVRLDAILLTHVHLDHAGGTGSLLQTFPETKVFCHPKGKPHLIAPKRLWQETLGVMGPGTAEEEMPIPLPEDSFLLDDFSLSGLTILETPGHASHHCSFLYEIGRERILFPGEAAGAFRRTTTGEIFVRPSSPPIFFLEKANESLKKLEKTNPTLICFPHYGYTRDTSFFLENSHGQLLLWRKLVAELLSAGRSEREIFEELLKRDPLLHGFWSLKKPIQDHEARNLTICIKGFVKSLLGA